MYKATYKCRLCGERFTGAETGRNTANCIIAQLCVDGKTEYPVMEQLVHNCPDGSIGYADFVGFKKGE